MSDLTTLASITRAIEATRNRLGQGTHMDLALAILADELKAQMVPEHLKEPSPTPAVTMQDGVAMALYQLDEVVEVFLVDAGPGGDTLGVTFKQPVNGDDARALYALLKDRPKVLLSLTAPKVEPVGFADHADDPERRGDGFA